MNTDLTVDLDLVTEDHQEEPCFECHVQGRGYVATWALHTADTCSCIPNPLPLCEGHKEGVDTYLERYGHSNWSCGRCGFVTNIVDIRRLRTRQA